MTHPLTIEAAFLSAVSRDRKADGYAVAALLALPRQAAEFPRRSRCRHPASGLGEIRATIRIFEDARAR